MSAVVTLVTTFAEDFRSFSETSNVDCLDTLCVLAAATRRITCDLDTDRKAQAFLSAADKWRSATDAAHRPTDGRDHGTLVDRAREALDAAAFTFISIKWQS